MCVCVCVCACVCLCERERENEKKQTKRWSGGTTQWVLQLGTKVQVTVDKMMHIQQLYHLFDFALFAGGFHRR